MRSPACVVAVVWLISTANAYSQSVITLPAKIEVEDYNALLSHDVTPGNQGGGCRSDGDADLFSTWDPPDLPTQCHLGQTETGEWVSFSIFAPETRTYVLSLRVASQGTGGQFHVEVDDIDVTGSLTVPNTGNWSHFTTIRRPVQIAAGVHVLKVKMDALAPSTTSRLRTRFHLQHFRFPGA